MFKPFLAAIALSVAVSATAAGRDNDYIYFAGGKQWAMMSGSTTDMRRARDIRSGQEAMLFFRRGDGAYVIRDPETLRRVDAILAPQAELGRRQGELGARQGALGAKQGALGAQQARLGVRQIDASSREQEELGRQQDALGRQQQELGRQQDALGRQQDVLGREQERVSREAEAKLGVLIEEAVKRGVAKRAD